MEYMIEARLTEIKRRKNKLPSQDKTGKRRRKGIWFGRCSVKHIEQKEETDGTS